MRLKATANAGMTRAEALLVGKLCVGDDTRVEGVGVKGGHGVGNKHSFLPLANRPTT